MTLIMAGATNAQSPAGTKAYTPPRVASGSSAAPVGPELSRLPTADAAQFENAQGSQSALQRTPETTPGVTSMSPDGKNIVAGAAAGKEAPAAYGSSTAPYTTARVALTNRGSAAANTVAGDPVTGYPYRATGKLLVRFGSSWYGCSASLIKKGVLITAAHCVFNYGSRDQGWANEVRFYPANISNYNTTAQPYGFYTWLRARIPTPYFNGTDTCTQAGVVCNNDIATITLNTANGAHAGNTVGWYAYGWNGYSYRASSFHGNVTTVQVSQLGYPLAFDSGYQMQRTDAAGWYFNSGNLKNTLWGSAQTGGSSGGPELVNFGTVPAVGGGASLGSDTVQAVVGVTSYLYTTVGYNLLGASFFGQNAEYPGGDYGGNGAGNIGFLVRDTCNSDPGYC